MIKPIISYARTPTRLRTQTDFCGDEGSMGSQKEGLTGNQAD
jgi:hypothetical protein